jgi:hypothetical protein
MATVAQPSQTSRNLKKDYLTYPELHRPVDFGHRSFHGSGRNFGADLCQRLDWDVAQLSPRHWSSSLFPVLRVPPPSGLRRKTLFEQFRDHSYRARQSRAFFFLFMTYVIILGFKGSGVDLGKTEVQLAFLAPQTGMGSGSGLPMGLFSVQSTWSNYPRNQSLSTRSGRRGDGCPNQGPRGKKERVGIPYSLHAIGQESER